MVTPYVPKSLKPKGGGWIGIPGGQHIPSATDPVFPHFTSIIADWMQAGVEMTEEYVIAAVKLAAAQVERSMERQLVEARHANALENAASKPRVPGEHCDNPKGVVYYIRRRGYVKIGTTTQLRARMRDLMPDEVLAVEPGSYKLEGELHVRFAHIRLSPKCEYFLLDEDLQAHIARVVSRVGPPPTGLTIDDFLAATP
ncbi:GIY-YIG nuclease family protein [Streptomyces sp. B21-101]|uniref:GIY-YIG nuclease family protein n=1 Tax=Streptomyces sp. B21-101 TaxID=3039415 RepID=UPI002FF21F2E